jgi:hypothetical protein
MQGKVVWEVSMYIPLETDLNPLYKKGEKPLIHSINTWRRKHKERHNVASREKSSIHILAL